MKLQEDINRIQSLITEDKGTVIKNMIDKHGLFHTIRLMGKYDPILNTIGFEGKIQFIRETIKYITKKYNTSGISIYELGMSPVRFGTPDPYGLEFQYIEYFNVDFVTVDVYDLDSHKGNFREKYENLDEETLDNVFVFMIDALEKYIDG